MNAVQMSRFGGPEVLKIVEVDRPAPAPGQVLVRVRAAGVNFAETLMRENRYPVTPELPSILGAEVAGVIESVGDGVERLAVGMRVAAPLFAGGAYFGGYAEYAVINAELVTQLPDTLPFEDATALMMQGLSALYLTKQVPPRGKAVLVTAAAGGFGSMLIQLAKRAGARKVIAAASTPEKLAFALSLGADVGVDYTKSNWVEQARAANDGSGPDIIYESVGGAVTKASLELLAPQGELVIYGSLNLQEFNIGVPELLPLTYRNQSVTGFGLPMLLTPEGLNTGFIELFELATRGQLKVTIGGTYPLDHAADAHRDLEGRGTTGKLVLVP